MVIEIKRNNIWVNGHLIPNYAEFSPFNNSQAMAIGYDAGYFKALTQMLSINMEEFFDCIGSVLLEN